MDRPARPRLSRAPLTALALVVLAGVALRVAGLGEQSFWRDEASTVLDLDGGPAHTWERLRAFEGMPPLYFVLAWPWAKVLGDGEAALRSLSALLGALTVPVAWAIGRRLAGTVAGVLAAALVAASPFLVWFSQEARAYALLVLLTAAATLLWLRAMDAPGRRDLVLWGLAAAGALASHWFGGFLVVPQAVALLLRHRRRALPGVAIPGVAGLALLPLLLAQRDARVDWVGQSPLASRVADVAKHWAAGPFGTPADALGALAALLLAGGVVLAAVRGGPAQRALLAVCAAALALPLLLAVAGIDYVLDRYLLPALVPLLALAAAGYATAPPRLLPLGAAALVALFAGFTADIAGDPEMHREDWRAVAARIATAPAPAAVVASRDGEPPLEVYLARERRLSGSAAVREVVVVASWRFGRPRPVTPPPPSPAFRLADRAELPTATVVRFSADAPEPLGEAALAALAMDRSEAPALLVTR